MRVLLLNHNPVGYGTYWRVFYLAKYASELGLDITMVCASDEDLDTSIKKKQIAKNFEIITLPRFKYGKYMSGQEIRLLLSVWQALTFDYDIVHAFTVAQPQIGFPALLAKYLRGKKLVVDWDDAWHEGFALYHRFPVRNILSFSELYVPKHADMVTVSSEFLHNKAEGIGVDSKRIVRIPNGCNSKEIVPLDKHECRKALNLGQGPFLLSMGHTYADTMDFLLEMFKKVLQSNHAARLILLSRIVLDDVLRKKIEELGDSIILSGEVPLDKFNLYLCAADIFLLPMRDSNIEKARFPIRFGDYLCAGRPVVSNAVGEVKRIIEKDKCGIACAVDDIEGMTNAIIKLLQNDAESASMGMRGREIAEKELLWQNIAKRLVDVYTNV